MHATENRLLIEISEAQHRLDRSKAAAEYGTLITSLRDAHGVSRDRLAQASGIAANTLSLLERGMTSVTRPSNPTLDTTLRIFHSLNFDVYLRLIERSS